MSPPSVLEPVSSDNLHVLDLERIQEVDRRHGLLAEYLSLKNLDAALLIRPKNFAWLSCGGDNTRRGMSEPVAAMFVTPDARLVLCGASDSGQLFDTELAGLGFQLKERPWSEDRDVLFRDLCRGRAVAVDEGLGETLDQDLADFRMALAVRDHARLRMLGSEVAHCVEASARQCEPGETEAEVAGQLAHRLIRRGIDPIQVQVMSDGQSRRYRHWSYSSDRIERFTVISVIGRRDGLHAGTSRTVCFGSPPQQLLDWHQHAALVQATGMFFSFGGWAFRETWDRVARIYEKFGAPDEWRAAEQAEVIGYDVCEASVGPQSTRKFVTGSAVHWHPSVGSASVADTILLTQTGFELLTIGENWPMLPVLVKNQPLPRPAIFCREAGPNGWSVRL